MLSLAWKDWERKASNFPPEVAFQLYSFHCYNPVSTGFDEKLLKRLSGLRQIVNVPTRNDAILDWCLVNLKEPIFLLKQLPPIGSSDHNALLVGPYVQRSTKPENKKVLKRDLRDSSLRCFGGWITTYGWKDV